MPHQNDPSCNLTTRCLNLHDPNHHRRTFLLLLSTSQPFPTQSEHVSPPPEMRSIFLTFSTRRKRSRTCLTGSVSISYATELFCAVQHSSNFWFVELQWHWQTLAFRAAPSRRYGLHSCPSPHYMSASGGDFDSSQWLFWISSLKDSFSYVLRSYIVTPVGGDTWVSFCVIWAIESFTLSRSWPKLGLNYFLFFYNLLVYKSIKKPS